VPADARARRLKDNLEIALCCRERLQGYLREAWGRIHSNDAASSLRGLKDYLEGLGIDTWRGGGDFMGLEQDTLRAAASELLEVAERMLVALRKIGDQERETGQKLNPFAVPVAEVVDEVERAVLRARDVKVFFEPAARAHDAEATPLEKALETAALACERLRNRLCGAWTKIDLARPSSSLCEIELLLSETNVDLPNEVRTGGEASEIPAAISGLWEAAEQTRHGLERVHNTTCEGSNACGCGLSELLRSADRACCKPERKDIDLGREEVDHVVCDILRRDGPGHRIDGHEKITDVAMALLGSGLDEGSDVQGPLCDVMRREAYKGRTDGHEIIAQFLNAVSDGQGFSWAEWYDVCHGGLSCERLRD
jgi:hypothetical protein